MYSGQNNKKKGGALSTHYPRLVADIGGTYSRFAVQRSTHLKLTDIQTYENKNFHSFASVIHAYLSHIDCRPRYATLAIAAAISGEQVIAANIGWPFSRTALQDTFQFTQLMVLNDFTALALALPQLLSDEYQQIGRGIPLPNRPLALIGPGTGLGVSALIPAPNGQWIPLQGEGGHISLPSMNNKEAELIQIIRQTHPHVSAERLLCGAGLPNLYHAMATLYAQTAKMLTARDIIQHALDNTCQICTDVLDTFCAMLGTVAGNLAMTLGAQGGLYLGGGIIPLLGTYFTHSPFRSRFEEKGRLHAYLAEIPTYVITANNPALRGAAAALML